MKTKEEIFEEYEMIKYLDLLIYHREIFSPQCTDAHDAATANHDQEIVEFGKYCIQHHRYTSPKKALTKFRKSK